MDLYNRKKEMIPQKQPGKKPKYNLKEAQIEDKIFAGKFSRALMLKVGSTLYYFNRILAPKKFVQRKVEDRIYIYREK